MSRPNVVKGTPGKLLLIYAFLVAGLAALAVHDFGAREELEGWDLPTGLGDDAWFENGDFDKASPIFSVDGEQVFPQQRKSVTRSDDEMLKVARSDETPHYLYIDAKLILKGAEPAPPRGYSPERQHYVKVGDGRYLKVGARKGGS